MATTEERDEAMRETLRHVRRVGDLLAECAADLTARAIHHDRSKFDPDEWNTFAEATSRLKGLTYGSAEYKASLAELGPAIAHHQKANRHHPEFHESGIVGMTLIDLIEMLCDWKAAGERHADGSMAKSLMHNKDRFGISPQLWQVLWNTAEAFGWMDDT